MLSHYYFPLIFFLFLILLIWADARFAILRNGSLASSFSWSRIQLSWWSLIILSSLTSILWVTGRIAEPSLSLLLLLGLSLSTTGVAKVVDSVKKAHGGNEAEGKSKGLLKDILWDSSGISIHRFQSLIINLTYGIWFIFYVVRRLDKERHCELLSSHLLKACELEPQNFILPDISDNNLLLLTLSAFTYSVLRTPSSTKKQTAKS